MEKRQKSNFQNWLKKDALAAGRAWFENDIEGKGKIAKDKAITFFDLCMKYKATFFTKRVSAVVKDSYSH